MIDFRLYRLAFLPALLAVVAVMFSLEGAPDALESATPPGTFEADRAAAAARQIATTAPDRRPGSEDDAATAGLVANRFEDVRSGAVSEQRFEASYDGEDVSLRNVLLTLPGDAESTIVIAAARDSAHSPAAASSAAATGILVELASALGVAGHEKTFVLASTSGSAAGGVGVRELVANLPERDSIDAVIVISQPGSAAPRRPVVVGASSGRTSAPVQLERTAELAGSTQAELSSSEASAFSQLARLAIPSGLGDQAPLIADGVDAIAISSAGERPLDSAADQLEDLSGESIDAFGRAIQSTVGALDIAAADPVHGPGAHLELGENLVPGWALAILALTLILPAAVAAVDGCARAARGGGRISAGLGWAAVRSLPFIGALAALYLLAIFGAVPRPPFPFDPGLYGLGARAVIAFALMLMFALASVILLRSRGVSAAGTTPSAVPALGAVATLSCVALWLANPYLALLLAPAAHLWLLASAEPGSRARGVLVVLATALACIPALAAVAAISSALELGKDAPWTLVIMVADGQIGLATTVFVCFLAGALIGGVELALRSPRTLPATG